MLIVQKYGGSSVADKERIMNVACRIKREYEKGNRLIVVLSAQGDTTDILKNRALEITKTPSKRELDMLLSTGEQQSVALMAICLHSIGIPAVSLNAAQFGLLSTSKYGDARIRRIDTERLNMELEKGNVVLIAGFQGINRYNDITTLGRGASDTTAVALAAVMNAKACEIYTDVSGVFTTDPRDVPAAVKLDAISYDEMLELASLGARILHTRCVELAKKYSVTLYVRSSLTDEPGTCVLEDKTMEKLLVSGVTVDKNVARISVIGVQDEPGVAFKLFSLLAKANISVDIILQSTGRDNTQDISFTVAKDDLRAAMDVLNTNKDAIGNGVLNYDDKIAKLSVVGAGMATNPGVASLLFEALYDVGVNIHMISTSEIKISVLINENDAKTAVRSVHGKFIE